MSTEAPKGANVKVICRIRPSNKLELSQGAVECVSIGEDGVSVAVKVRSDLVL